MGRNILLVTSWWGEMVRKLLLPFTGREAGYAAKHLPVLETVSHNEKLSDPEGQLMLRNPDVYPACMHQQFWC